MAKWATGDPPKKRGRYIVTYKAEFTLQVRQAERCEYPKGNWFWSLLPSGSVSDKEIIAWQKQPEPYKK